MTIPVTMTTMPSTQKSPGHDVKSTCQWGNSCVTGELGVSPPPSSLRLTPPQGRAGHIPLLALVWKQKMVTMMATMAVMSMAIRTALVRYVLQMEGTPESPHASASPWLGGVGDPPQPRSQAGTPLSLSPGDRGVPWLPAASHLSRLHGRGQGEAQLLSP